MTETATPDKPSVEESKKAYNAHYHHCDTYNGRTSYAVCLHTFQAFKDGRLSQFMREYCEPAIRSKTCAALKMRAEELQAGHAIYFSDRRENEKKFAHLFTESRSLIQFRQPKTEAERAERARRFAAKLVPTPVSLDAEPNPAPKSAPAPTKDAPKIVTLNMGDAVNNMMEELSESERD